MGVKIEDNCYDFQRSFDQMRQIPNIFANLDLQIYKQGTDKVYYLN